MSFRVKYDPWAALAVVGQLVVCIWTPQENSTCRNERGRQTSLYLYIKDIPLEEGQNAEIALYRQKPPMRQSEFSFAGRKLSACLSCNQDEHTIISMEAALQIAETTQETHRYCTALSSQKFLTSHNRAAKKSSDSRSCLKSK